MESLPNWKIIWTIGVICASESGDILRKSGAISGSCLLKYQSVQLVEPCTTGLLHIRQSATKLSKAGVGFGDSVAKSLENSSRLATRYKLHTTPSQQTNRHEQSRYSAHCQAQSPSVQFV
uniref:(northern house mosquito) hypothetical protein n=1 Tax=Culex pipiens TaxID=7175 RepID=A0A8D8BXP0_CULPI